MSLSPFLLVIVQFWGTAVSRRVKDSRLRAGFKTATALFTKRRVDIKPVLALTFYCTCGAVLGTYPTSYTLITYFIRHENYKSLGIEEFRNSGIFSIPRF